MSFKKGDKVKFNKETIELYKFWLNDESNCGRLNFCNDIKKFDFENCYFTISKIYPCGRVDLKELPIWYFNVKEFKESEE